MRRLSATEAFTPAFEHTKSMLRPLSVRLWVKLGLVAFLAEMGGQAGGVARVRRGEEPGCAVGSGGWHWLDCRGGAAGAMDFRKLTSVKSRCADLDACSAAAPL